MKMDTFDHIRKENSKFKIKQFRISNKEATQARVQCYATSEITSV
jgi:hypothetical protein